MAAYHFPRDIYDLYYGRSKQQQYVRFPDGQARNKRLDDLSRLIRQILEKRDALVFCQNFLTCVLESRPHLLTGIDNSVWADALPPSRPDTDTEEEELRARLHSLARDGLLQSMQIQTLKQLGETVRQRRWEDASWYEGPHLLYRVHHPESYTFYHQDVGFCCPKWLVDRNFDKPSEEDFRRHVNGDIISSKGGFETPYISMTGSPSRALNLVPYDQMSSSDVFVIYAERLWATSIPFERTTSIADRYGIKYRGPRGIRMAEYVTKTHWVAQYWIPDDCIVVRVPFGQFEAICRSRGIFRGI